MDIYCHDVTINMGYAKNTILLGPRNGEIQTRGTGLQSTALPQSYRALVQQTIIYNQMCQYSLI